MQIKVKKKYQSCKDRLKFMNQKKLLKMKKKLN